MHIMYQSINTIKNLINKSKGFANLSHIKNYMPMPFMSQNVYKSNNPTSPPPIPRPPPISMIDNLQINNWVTYTRGGKKHYWQGKKLLKLN